MRAGIAELRRRRTYPRGRLRGDPVGTRVGVRDRHHRQPRCAGDVGHRRSGHRRDRTRVCIVTQMHRRNAYTGFGVFGAFWGVWGASLPAIRDRAAVSDGQLGTALLFIGAGALAAMLLAGRAVDRWHERATAALLTLLGLAGVVVVLAAHDFVRLALSLVLLGAASGAADVAINTAAGAAQRTHGGAVIVRSHATFSGA